MIVDHLGKLLVAFQALPFEACPPVFEKSPCLGLTFIIPKLAEALFQQIGGVESLIGIQQDFERSLAAQ
jgi:hypothetical protein